MTEFVDRLFTIPGDPAMRLTCPVKPLRELTVKVSGIAVAPGVRLKKVLPV